MIKIIIYNILKSIELVLLLTEKMSCILRKSVESKSYKYGSTRMCTDSKECFDNSLKNFYKHSNRGRGLIEFAKGVPRTFEHKDGPLRYPMSGQATKVESDVPAVSSPDITKR